MTCWIRADQSHSKNIRVFTHSTSNWIGRCHTHDDRVQWVMPVKKGYRLSTTRSSKDIPVSTVTIIPPEQEHSHLTRENPSVVLISLNRLVMSRIHKTAQHGRIPGTSMMLEALGMQLAIAWLQAMGQQIPKFQHEQAIRKLCTQLRKNVSHSWTTLDMAHEVALSPAQFLRCFKEVTQTTPHQFLLGLRLEYAIEKLSRTHKPINAIAQECGFQSLRGLEMALRSRYGVSPSQLRGCL